MPLSATRFTASPPSHTQLSFVSASLTAAKRLLTNLSSSGGCGAATGCYRSEACSALESSAAICLSELVLGAKSSSPSGIEPKTASLHGSIRAPAFYPLSLWFGYPMWQLLADPEAASSHERQVPGPGASANQQDGGAGCGQRITERHKRISERQKRCTQCRALGNEENAGGIIETIAHRNT